MKPKQLIVKTDGGARGNPGPAAIGVFITDAVSKKRISSFGKYIGRATNNVAEYRAVLEALKFLMKNQSVLTNKYTSILIVSDSKLLVNQLQGIYKVKKAHLQKLCFQIKTLELQIKAPISYKHVARELNKEPDMILNQALDGHKT